MDKTQKMLQTVINGQSAMKSEVLGEIKKLRGETSRGFEDVNKKLTNLTKRVDTIGLQTAKLEDDAPTVEEFDKLEKRVTKVEQKVASI